MIVCAWSFEKVVLPGCCFGFLDVVAMFWLLWYFSRVFSRGLFFAVICFLGLSKGPCRNDLFCCSISLEAIPRLKKNEGEFPLMSSSSTVLKVVFEVVCKLGMFLALQRKSFWEAQESTLKAPKST